MQRSRQHVVKDAVGVCMSSKDAYVGSPCWLSSKDGVDSKLQLGGQRMVEIKSVAEPVVWKLTLE